MREILFRAKRVDDNEWVYGCLILNPYNNKECCIFCIDGEHKGMSFAAYLETVGQYTGITDRNETKIFEGDILKWDEKEYGSYCHETCEWDYDLLSLRENDWHEWCEVVNNIHDVE